MNSNSTNIPSIPDNWRQWIALNLMQNASIKDLDKVLKKNGFHEMAIAMELHNAKNSPYIMAGQQLNHILRKRDWLLSTNDRLARMDKSYNETIDTIETPSFAEFIKNYYSKHRPVVLKNGIKHWKALEVWKPKYFAEKLGDAEVEIQFDRDSDPNFERNSVKLKKIMPMRDFVDLLENTESSNNYYMTANNNAKSMQNILPIFDDIGDFGEGYRKPNSTEGTFFWMGPKGTFTPLHHDLTNNMLVQVYGSKKVTLIPAWQVPSLYNDTHVFSQTDFPNMDFDKFPLLRDITPIEIEINTGDAIFIPIAWWHCVESLSTSISISFTNFNIANNQGDDFPKG